MRSLLALLLAAGVPIAIGVVAACGPPSSFDGLTNGTGSSDAAAEAEASVPTQEDPTLEPPRPVAPLAGSWINGSRPRFRWALAGSTVGARVVVCPDPACTDPAKTKTWFATGAESQAPEDLAPGRYFWHVVSTTAETFGTKRSATWPLLVRGGAGDGVPGGSFADFNGDGIADLAVAIEVSTEGRVYRDALVIVGSSPDDAAALVSSYESETSIPRAYEVGGSENLVIDAVDIDGDGIGDIVFADRIGAAERASVFAYRGTAAPAFPPPVIASPPLPGLDVVPRMTTPGDVDGDGYGDVLIGTRLTGIALFGGPDGLGPFSFVDQWSTTVNADAGQIPASETVPSAIGGTDVNNDGRTDVARPAWYVNQGVNVFHMNLERELTYANVGVHDEAGVETPAIRFGFGDMDADGINDVALLTTSGGGKPAVCIVTSAASATTGGAPCWIPDAPAAGFASSIVAADLEGDGKDELLVGSASGGVDILRLPSPDRIEVEHLAIDFGTSLTVLDPGRPRPAVWAATRPDGMGVALFVGREQKRVITPAELSDLGDYTVLRFQAGLR